MTKPSPPHAVAFAAAVLLLAGAGQTSADWALGVDGGYFAMTNAEKSAKAIFNGSSGGGTIGGFFQLGLGQSFFVSAHGRYFEKTGERVFVVDAGSEVFRLGHPLTIRLIPVYGMVGYRFIHSARWAPYVAVGMGATSYRETSDVAGLIETQSATKAAYHLAAGVDFLTGPIRFGVEVTYSLVPKTIGESGVSKVYGEDDVGGATIVARLAFGSRN
jgi:outer membrane protein with beta-barrel domain